MTIVAATSTTRPEIGADGFLLAQEPSVTEGRRERKQGGHVNPGLWTRPRIIDGACAHDAAIAASAWGIGPRKVEGPMVDTCYYNVSL